MLTFTWLALAHKVESGIRENTKVDISKRIEQILREERGKRLTNSENERLNGSSRRRRTYPSSNAITLGRKGILHMIAKSPIR